MAGFKRPTVDVKQAGDCVPWGVWYVPTMIGGLRVKGNRCVALAKSEVSERYGIDHSTLTGRKIGEKVAPDGEMYYAVVVVERWGGYE